MSTHENKISTLNAMRQTLPKEALSLLDEIRSQIPVTATTTQGAQAVAQAISHFPEEPGRRKPVSPANQYTDNNPYRDHVPYKDGYSDRYNDHRYKP